MLRPIRMRSLEETNSIPSTKAKYFVSEKGGEIDSLDLQQHPEIEVVHTFSDLKEKSGKENAIWIDKK